MTRSPAASTSRIVPITSASICRKALPGSQNLTDKSVTPVDDRLNRPHDPIVIEAMERFQISLVADDLVELGPQADALQRSVAGFQLGKHFCDRSAETSLNAVFLEREHKARLRGGAHDRLAVQGLDRVHAQEPH